MGMTAVILHPTRTSVFVLKRLKCAPAPMQLRRSPLRPCTFLAESPEGQESLNQEGNFAVHCAYNESENRNGNQVNLHHKSFKDTIPESISSGLDVIVASGYEFSELSLTSS
ncbi:uncharacterized protein G2W53_002806 [Senna tora]|uniref:Uncharacterized protein n=1 Tax=Senna tora TaxID=362788 RepID=A0A834XBE9_9FABA|nr:uncharacterized protein G2W53_002806 [Senna tora]